MTSKMSWCDVFFNPKVSVWQKHQNHIYNITKIYYKWNVVSQMNPNDNQIVQCCDGYVMTSPWHDTKGLSIEIDLDRDRSRLNPGVNFTIFEAEKSKNYKRIYVELTRDLESDCDVTISVTCRIYSTTHNTLSIFVSMLQNSRPRKSKMIKLFMYNSRVT